VTRPASPAGVATRCAPSRAHYAAQRWPVGAPSAAGGTAAGAVSAHTRGRAARAGGAAVATARAARIPL